MAPTTRQNGRDKLIKKPGPAKWTAVEEKMYIQLMVEEVRKGNWSSTKFTNVGWEHIQRELCKRTNKRYSKIQLTNKFHRLKKSYPEFNGLLKQPDRDPDGLLYPLPQMTPTTRKNGQDKLRKTPGPAKWTAVEEKMFIQLMVEEFRKGNWSSTRFTRVGWEHIQREFCQRTNKMYNIIQFTNKFHRLKKSYHDVLATDGLQANRGAYKFWNNGCPMFNELRIIFGKLTAEGKYVFPTAKYSVKSEDESLNATPSDIPRDSSDGKDNPSQSTGRKRDAARAAIVDDATKEMVVEDTAPSWGPSEFSIRKCVKCLESFDGVGKSAYIKAIKMFKDGDWREMFMAMSAKRRVAWLASLE